MYLITVPMFGQSVRFYSKRMAFKYASCRSFIDNTLCFVYKCNDNDDDNSLRRFLRLYDCGKLKQEV